VEFISGITFLLVLCRGFAGKIARAQRPEDEDFTSVLLLKDRGGFKTTGANH
jgi:hypothetical protein